MEKRALLRSLGWSDALLDAIDQVAERIGDLAIEDVIATPQVEMTQTCDRIEISGGDAQIAVRVLTIDN
jgi:hypothetical protein